MDFVIGGIVVLVVVGGFFALVGFVRKSSDARKGSVAPPKRGSGGSIDNVEI